MKIERQFSIQDANKSGAFLDLIKKLADEKINILAFTLNDGEGVLRFVADAPDKVKRLLSDAVEEEVLAMELPHRPGSFSVIFSRLEEKGIPVDYAYASGIGPSSLAIVHVGDIKRAQEILTS
jgi:hypothetical protein